MPMSIRSQGNLRLIFVRQRYLRMTPREDSGGVYRICREQDAAIVRSGRCGPGHSSSSRYLRRAFMA
jgi:hypothetical protein